MAAKDRILEEIQRTREDMAMQLNSVGVSGFASHGPMSGAAWDMVIRSDPADVLRSQPILDLVELPNVPSNELLIKGIFEHQGSSVPLVDARIPLSFNLVGKPTDACALIVDIEGVQVGLIIGGVTQA